MIYYVSIRRPSTRTGWGTITKDRERVRRMAQRAHDRGDTVNIDVWTRVHLINRRNGRG